MAEKERNREESRIPFEVRYTGEGKSYYFSDYSLDLSASGIGINSIRALEVDELVRLTFRLPDETNVVVSGRVVWNGERPDVHRRSGLQFVDLDPSTKEKILQVVNESSEG